MPVYRDRKSGHWTIRLQIGGQRVQRSAGPAARKEDALQLEASIRRDALDGRLGKAPARSLEDALLRWLETEAANLRDRVGHTSKARSIRPYCAGRALTQIADAAEALKADGIKQGLSAATINRRLAILRRIANLAHDQWGWLDRPLGQRIKLMPGERARHTYLTPAQVEHLAECCEHPRVAQAIRLAARTGLRQGELLRADTVHDDCIVVSESKSGRPRLVPIPPDMADLTLPLGITYATLRTYFERARVTAGLPQVRFHDLRHTAASWWASAGANLTILRDLLGHSTLAMTGRYAHLMTGDLKRASREVAEKRRKENNKASEIKDIDA
jgi:integrase